MPNWAIHLIVPLLVLLLLSKKDHYKYILVLLPFSVLPDADVMFYGHRALLHNIFIPIIIFIAARLFVRTRGVLLIVGFYFASHVFLDVFNGGIAPFYPINDGVAFINAVLQLTQDKNLLLTFEYGFGQRPSVIDWYGNYEVFDNTGFGLFALILVSCMIYMIKNKNNKRD